MKIILRDVKYSVFFLAFLFVSSLIHIPVPEPVNPVFIHDAEAFRPGPPGPRGVTRRTTRRTARRVNKRHAVVGSRIYTLPPGCTSIIRHGFRHYHCSGVYYRPYYEGNQVVYVIVD